MNKKTKMGKLTTGGEETMLKITPRSEDYSKWYLSIVAAADLAENAPVKGCMTIKPYGYAIWEIIQGRVDRMFKAKGVKNAYFPLFIPQSFISKEAEHIKGFSPELAVVTHGGGKKLEEPLIVRPTSETIIYEAYARWIKSYRDLPLIINQWANVVRWEMRPRVFLRTTEFLWQEGHTAHISQEESEAYALMILEEVYRKFTEDYLAIPVYTGRKSESEKFAGAKQTFTLEATMQDGKFLQMGTSHDLSDHFAKSFDVTYLDREGKSQFVHSSCWGVSTRLIGGLIMSHSDDRGLVLPPKIAPIEVIIIPICDAENIPVMQEVKRLNEQLTTKHRSEIDNRFNLRPGEKFYDWEKKGVPVRIEIGPKDLEKNQCILVRRDTGEKIPVSSSEVIDKVEEILIDIQQALYQKARQRREDRKVIADTWTDFIQAIEKGNFVFAHWCETDDCEATIKEKTKATTRCLPFESPKESSEHECVHCGKVSPSNRRWIFARSY